VAETYVQYFLFQEGGSVTAGNSSGTNDGAAAVLLMSADEAAARKIPVLARIVGFAQSGCDPAIMGIGPVAAVQSLVCILESLSPELMRS